MQPISYSSLTAWDRKSLRRQLVSEQILVQGGTCALCDNSDSLVIDHCHETGALRGMLCASCNHNMSAVDNEDGGWLLRAVVYRNDGGVWQAWPQPQQVPCRCHATTPRGTQCQLKAFKGIYCAMHQHWEESP